jgi:integrase/recombinase XerD
MLSKECLEEFKLECELRRLSPRTIKSYYNSTMQFLTYAEQHQKVTELESIRPQHIKQYIQYLQLRGGNLY